MPKKVIARFYATKAGAEPVREWLRRLDSADRKTIGNDIALVEFGWPVGMPTCRSLGGGLWEVRSNISDGRIARVIFAFESDAVVLLHAFVKKTSATPKDDLTLARKRHRE